MKKQIAIWTTVILLGAVVVYTLVRLPGDTSVPQSPPDFSLSRGPTGMVDGSASYFFSYNDSVGSPIPTDQLIETIQRYLRSQGDENLKVARLREFVWVYQAEIVERSTGRNAFGLMISKYTGQISPKAGPNIFWNTEYGSKIAEVGGGYGMVGRLLPLPPQQETTLAEGAARQIATSAIKEVDSTLELSKDVNPYYGFYEYHVVRNDQLVGELDVNVYSGQVWYKDWGEAQGAVIEVSVPGQT